MDESHGHRPQTDLEGEEGMRARRVRWTASNELRRNGKQSFLAWVAWLTLIERGWAGGDRGNKAKRKKRRRRRRKALPVNEQRLQGGTVNAQTRHRLTITLSPSIYPQHPLPFLNPLNRPCRSPLLAAESPFAAMQTGKRKTERKTQGKMWTESFSFCRVRWPMTMTTMTVPANTLRTQIDTDTNSDNDSAHVGRHARLSKYPVSA